MQKQNLSPKDYAAICCNAMMKEFAAPDLPPQGRFHYHQGVLLSGFERTFRSTGNQAYDQYIRDWVNSQILPNGAILNYRDYELDGMMAGLLLFDLYDRTQDDRYTKALDVFIRNLKNWKFTPGGGFYHMLHLTDQMWLDGFYMASPMLVRYALQFNDESLIELAHRQMTLMWENMRDPETGLLYHAWDCSKKASWSNPETGLSAEFWGRAMGWYVVAAVDIAALLPETHPKRQAFIDITVKLLTSLAKYQEPTTGLWYQVVNKGHLADNWLETSCSALYTYAMSKAVRFGWMDAGYKSCAAKGYQGVIDTIETDGETYLTVPRICIGTCLGDYKFYVNRPAIHDMLIGVGAFLLMCNEYQELLDAQA